MHLCVSTALTVFIRIGRQPDSEKKRKRSITEDSGIVSIVFRKLVFSRLVAGS